MIYLRIYEHRSLRTDRAEDGVKITPSQLRLLQEYHGEKGTPYFTLINNGVKFCEYVGVLQVGNLIIEVLPKTDASDDKNTWQQFLVTMLRKTGMLDIEQTGFASLKIIGNSILDLYFLLFLQEAKYLLQTGLVKKYRTTERNSFSLRGNLIFGKHVSKNIVHAERFYVRNSNYSYDNTYNGILVKTVKLIAAIGKPSIGAKAKSILVDLPECSDMLISESTFTKLVFDRKTDGYRNAMNIARLLLLNYHPDVRRGSNNVIALMFDMNLLWERYIFRTLKKALGEKYPCEYIVKEQVPTGFWKPQAGYIKTIRPDIVVYRSSRADEAFLVLDTKWKQPASNKPDDADLKQMLAYNLYKKSYRSALVYPGIGSTGVVEGNFQIAGHGGCSLVFLPLKAATGNIQLDLDNLLSLFAVLS